MARTLYDYTYPAVRRPSIFRRKKRGGRAIARPAPSDHIVEACPALAAAAAAALAAAALLGTAAVATGGRTGVTTGAGVAAGTSVTTATGSTGVATAGTLDGHLDGDHDALLHRHFLRHRVGDADGVAPVFVSGTQSYTVTVYDSSFCDGTMTV